MSPITPLTLADFTDTVSAWLFQAVFYGSLVAALTWILIKTVFRNARPAVHAVLWLVVLLKFIVPFGPGAPFSLASLLGEWTGFAPVTAVPLPAPAAPADCGVAYVFVQSTPCAAAEPTQHTAAASVVPWSPLAWLIASYGVLVAVLALWRIAAYIRFARRCAAYPAADGSTLVVVSVVCRRLGVRRLPDVRISDTANAPFVFGVLWPRLTLARRHLADRAELEAVLLHEIAHLRRGDLLVRHFQWLVGTLLFFWPVVAWVNRRIDLLREYACDEWALRHGRLSAGDYARCLLRAVQPVRSPWMQFRPAAMAATRVNVERRIDMILSAKPSASRRWMWMPIGSAVAVWGAFVLSGAAPASGAAAKKARSDDPLTWFGNAIEEQVSRNQSSQRMVVVVNKVSDVEGDADSQMEVRVLDAAEVEGLPLNMSLHGGHAPRVFISHSADGLTEHGEFQSIVINERSDEELAAFLADHPTADANADGALSASEQDAYLTALALSDSPAVLKQFPFADRNSDGALDATEAARLVTDGPEAGMPPCDMFMEHVANAGGAGGVAGVAMKIIADVETDGADAQPGVIRLRTRIVGEDGKEIAVHDADGQIAAPTDAPADCERRVIVKRVTQSGDGPVDVQITVNGQPVDASEMDEIAEPKAVPGVPMIRMLRAHAAGTAGDGAWTDAAGATFNFKVAPPPAHWLAENLSADVTVAEVAALLPTVEQAPLAAFLDMNPESDADADGKVTPEERTAFVDKRMSKARTKLLERFPTADADKDGLLTNEELHNYFKNNGPHGEWHEKAAPKKADGVMGPPLPGTEKPATDGC